MPNLFSQGRRLTMDSAISPPMPRNLALETSMDIRFGQPIK